MQVINLHYLQLPKAPASEAPVICRVMPNTPALVGCGASVYALSENATEKHVRGLRPQVREALTRNLQAAVVESLFSTVGTVDRLFSEKQINAVTGLSGSGPAYVRSYAHVS